jgi:hypothetical protein
VVSEERIRAGCDTHDVAYTNAHSVRSDVTRDGFVGRETTEDVDEESASGVVQSGPKVRWSRRNIETRVDGDVGSGGGRLGLAIRRHGRREEKQGCRGREVQRFIELVSRERHDLEWRRRSRRPWRLHFE